MRGRGFGWGSAALGGLGVVLLLGLIGAALIFGGLVPVAASGSDRAAVSSLIHSTMERSVRRSADGLRPPRLSRADALEGGSHFKGMCQQCHGGPGAKPEQFATAMNPAPPDLSQSAGEWTQAQLFWIAKHGIRMTGMPAFGKVADDEELWKIAAFVDQLPTISADTYASLPDAHAQERAGDGHSHSH